MSVAKSLSDEQVVRIRSWAEEGAQLPDIQRRLDSELGVKVTYMEVRFLLGDLGIELKSPEPEPEPEKEPGEDSLEDEGYFSDEAGADDDEGASPGGVKVSFSELVRPGTAASGRVTFANGKTAEWWVDQYGRLGLNPDDREFRPSETDMLEFQRELQRVARQRGY